MGPFGIGVSGAFVLVGVCRVSNRLGNTERNDSSIEENYGTNWEKPQRMGVGRDSWGAGAWDVGSGGVGPRPAGVVAAWMGWSAPAAVLDMCRWTGGTPGIAAAAVDGYGPHPERADSPNAHPERMGFGPWPSEARKRPWMDGARTPDARTDAKRTQDARTDARRTPGARVDGVRTRDCYEGSTWMYTAPGMPCTSHRAARLHARSREHRL